MQKVCLGRCVVLVHLKTAIFSKREHVRMLSGNLVFLMMEGTRDARKLLEALLPRVDFFVTYLCQIKHMLCDVAFCLQVVVTRSSHIAYTDNVMNQFACYLGRLSFLS